MRSGSETVGSGSGADDERMGSGRGALEVLLKIVTFEQ